MVQLCRLLPPPEDGRKYSRRPMLRCFPRLGGVVLDLYDLYHAVCQQGGLVLLTRQRGLTRLARSFGVPSSYRAAGVC